MPKKPNLKLYISLLHDSKSFITLFNFHQFQTQ